jgi:manganese/zinc/iron transport system permease protein
MKRAASESAFEPGQGFVPTHFSACAVSVFVLLLALLVWRLSVSGGFLAYNTLVVLAGTSLLGAGAGLVGCFAVLRRRALLGDALAHAGLPGICLAFWFWGERSMPVLLLGALATGVLGVVVVSLVRGYTRIKEDAAIGIVLSTFFGAGMVLSRMIQNRLTTGSKAGLDSYNLGKTAGMIAADVYLIAGVSLVCLLVVLICYKEFKLVAFDPALARVQGWPALRLDLLLTLLIAVMVVIGLPAVGVVLMAAMLILPGAMARFWTDRLGTLLTISALAGASVGGLGTLASAHFSFSPAGPVIVLVGAIGFLLSMAFAPRRGVLARLWSERAFRLLLNEQKFLANLFARASTDQSARSFTAGDNAVLPSVHFRSRQKLVDRLVQQSLALPVSGGRFKLSSSGWKRAARIARGYRLWESFLRRYPELAHSYANLDAESIDDVLPPAIVAELETELKRAGRWPDETPLIAGRGAP